MVNRIYQAFEDAYKKMDERHWEKIYVAIDIHDTIFKGCYEKKETYKWLGRAKQALQKLSDNPKTCLILWSSVYACKLNDYIDFFKKNGIIFEYINENPECESDVLACFDTKFYFNVLLDDKAGFHPRTDWKAIEKFLDNNK